MLGSKSRFAKYSWMKPRHNIFSHFHKEGTRPDTKDRTIDHVCWFLGENTIFYRKRQSGVVECMYLISADSDSIYFAEVKAPMIADIEDRQ